MKIVSQNGTGRQYWFWRLFKIFGMLSSKIYVDMNVVRLRGKRGRVKYGRGDPGSSYLLDYLLFFVRLFETWTHHFSHVVVNSMMDLLIEFSGISNHLWLVYAKRLFGNITACQYFLRNDTKSSEILLTRFRNISEWNDPSRVDMPSNQSMMFLISSTVFNGDFSCWWRCLNCMRHKNLQKHPSVDWWQL